MYFLEQTAKYILDNFADQLLNIQVVFPNKRSGLFLKYFLAKNITQPVWCPKITDIETFILDHTAYLKSDPIAQNFQLYRIYADILTQNHQQAESIDQFYPWGNIILNDFSEIDKNLALPSDVFRLIEDIKTIDSLYHYLSEDQLAALKSFWLNINIEKRTVEKEKFLRMWQILPQMYEGLRKIQIEQKQAYTGLIYRLLAELCLTGNWNPEENYIIFAGFNALTKAESIIFSYLQQKNKAVFLWDYNEYFLEKQDFPAYEFIRNNLKKFPEPEGFSHENHSLAGKKFHVIGFDQTITQVGFATRIIKKTQQFNEFLTDQPETAVVLADEKLLIPLLYSFPEEAEQVNVTMGYPLKDSYPSDLIILFADFFRKYNQKTSIHLSDLTALMVHPLIQKISSGASGLLLQQVNSAGLVYIDLQSLSTDFVFLSLIIDLLQKDQSIPEKLSEITVFFLDNERITEIEKELFYQIYKSLMRLTSLIQDNSLSDSLSVKLLKEILFSQKVAFAGEPLSGIQIMGVLETRCLDFKNLIVVSLNEGMWPKGRSQSSLIPYQVRKAFYLSTPEHEDAVYAYYFYRLLQQAENIWLLYSNDQESTGFAEKSRYILQLKYDFNLNLRETMASPSISNLTHNEIVYRKDEAVLMHLGNYLNENEKLRFSPSALLAYLDCKLKFFFQYILKIKEKEKISDKIDHAVFGKILHRTMELLYSRKEIKHHDLEAEIVRALKVDFHQEMNEAVKEFFLKNAPETEMTGFNLVAIEMIKHFIQIILDHDADYTPFRVVSLEDKSKTLIYDFSIELNNKTIRPGISGIIDRIDFKNGVYRAVDYKTGKENLNLNIPGIESLFLPANEKRNKAAFQLLCYCLLMKYSGKFQGKILPALYMVREMAQQNFSPYFKLTGLDRNTQFIDDFSRVEDEFVRHLTELLSEIFNPDVPFTPCDNVEICKVCPYRNICIK